MFICSVCSFSCTYRREWERHASYFGHSLNTDDENDDGDHNRAFAAEEMENLEDSYEQYELDPAENPPPNISVDSDSHVSPHDESDEEEDPWYPFLSRAHFYLTCLYHGSHRRYY